jgi:thiamine pyrophosphate-dependent acetolactate synthase large subunit-like protein
VHRYNDSGECLYEPPAPDLVDWVHLAKAMGVPGTRVTRLDTFERALEAGSEAEGPTLKEVPLLSLAARRR